MKPLVYVYLSLICFLAAHFVYAQPTAEAIFVQRCEIQTNAPLAFPHYYRDETLSQALLAEVAIWAKQRFGAKVVDYKQKQAIAYQAVVLTDDLPRSLRNTAYQMGISITGQIIRLSESPKKARLQLTLLITDNADRRVMRRLRKTEFIITPNQAFFAEAWLSREDFTNLYMATLKNLLYDRPTPKLHTFAQPADAYIQDFVQEAQAIEVEWLEQPRALQWKSPRLTRQLEIIPKPTDSSLDTLERVADLRLGKRLLPIRAVLRRRNPDRVLLVHGSSDTLIAQGYVDRGSEQQVLVVKAGRSTYRFTRNLSTGTGILYGQAGGIEAVWQRKTPDTQTVYISPMTTTALEELNVSILFYEALANALWRDLAKAYQGILPRNKE